MFIPNTPWTIAFASIIVVQSLASIGLGAGLYRTYMASFEHHMTATWYTEAVVIGQLCTILLESVYLVGICLVRTLPT